MPILKTGLPCTCVKNRKSIKEKQKVKNLVTCWKKRDVTQKKVKNFLYFGLCAYKLHALNYEVISIIGWNWCRSKFTHHCVPVSRKLQCFFWYCINPILLITTVLIQSFLLVLYKLSFLSACYLFALLVDTYYTYSERGLSF